MKLSGLGTKSAATCTNDEFYARTCIRKQAWPGHEEKVENGGYKSSTSARHQHAINIFITPTDHPPVVFDAAGGLDQFKSLEASFAQDGEGVEPRPPRHPWTVCKVSFSSLCMISLYEWLRAWLAQQGRNETFVENRFRTAVVICFLFSYLWVLYSLPIRRQFRKLPGSSFLHGFARPQQRWTLETILKRLHYQLLTSYPLR